MSNISSKDAQGVLKQAASAIRTLQQQNIELQEKLAAKAQEERIVKIAREMEEKNLSDNLSFEEKVANLRQAQNLDVTEQAVKMAAPQGNRWGGLDNDESTEMGPSRGNSAFEHFIMTGETE